MTDLYESPAYVAARDAFIKSREPQHEADYAEAGFRADNAAELARLLRKFGADAEREFAPLIADGLAVNDKWFLRAMAATVTDRIVPDELASVFDAVLAEEG